MSSQPDGQSSVCLNGVNMFGQTACVSLWFVLLSVVAICDGHVKQRFDNHQVFSVDVETEQQIETLRRLQDGNYDSGISLWNGLRGRGKSSDVLVAPHKLAEFKDMLSRLGLKSTLVVKNVQTSVPIAILEGIHEC